jgi:hypothetical protein
VIFSYNVGDPMDSLTQELTVSSSSNMAIQQIDFDDDMVVFKYNRNGPEIGVLDLTTGGAFELTDTPAPDYWPFVSDGLVVWETGFKNNGDKIMIWGAKPCPGSHG